MWLVLLVLSVHSLAAQISQKELLDYADKYSYSDNRKNLGRDKVYSAQKGDRDEETSTLLLAFPGPKSFRQVALMCNRCGADLSLEVCKNEFIQLYQKLTGKEPSSKLIAKIQIHQDEKQKLDSFNSQLRLRLSSGALYCDGARGNGLGSSLRFDFFLN